MAAPKFSNWFGVEDGEEIPAEHLPASFWQYRWRIDADIDIPDSWFIGGGGLLKARFGLNLAAAGATDVFTSDDEIHFLCVVQRDLFTAGLIAFWSYSTGLTTMTGRDNYPCIGFPFWEYWGLWADWGLWAGDIDGMFTSPVYHLDLPAGTVVDVTRHYYSNRLPHGYVLEMRTALGGATAVRNRMLIDPVAADRHVFRVTNKALTRRTRLSAEGAFDGIQSGLTVALADGVCAVTAGEAILNYGQYYLAAADSIAVGGGTQYLFAVPTGPGLLHLEVSDGPLDVPGLCLGMIEDGKTLTRLNGVLVAVGVTDFAVGRHEDGVMVVTYDTADGDDLTAISRDRGMTWTAG